MPIFILLCLSIAFLVQIGFDLQKVLPLSWLAYSGLSIGALAIIGSFLKKIPEMLSYDIFASGALMAWFALWKPLFVKDSPIFFFFPVYFALLASLVALYFLSQRHRIDQADLKLMQSIADSGVADPWLLMLLVLITLYFENHFLQYPVAMTLVIIRFTLSGCLLPANPSK